MVATTPAVARALEVANLHALGAGAGEVHTEHLVQGLLAEEEGRAATLAVSAGLRLEAYRESWGPLGEEGGESLPLSDLSRKAHSRARELAVELTGERTLSSEPLLLALLQTDDHLRARLEALGLSADVLEANLHREKPPIPTLEEPLLLTEPVEQIDTARILDAGANRVREALRVIEDYCRFVLEDAFLCGELKRLRHDFTEAIQEFAPPWMLQARETQRDVGTEIGTERERTRASLVEVVRVNLKRLQEALRSLEEFAKVVSPPLGERLEQIRYRSYTLERAILLGGDARLRLRQARLYLLLTGANCASGIKWTIEQAALGGVSVVQLREKTLNDGDLLQRARDVRRWTHEAGVLFIVNDRPDIARLAEADGLHLGQEDLPVKDARRILGAEAIIGVSTHSIEQVRRAVLDGASYIGVGPAFPSTTKAFEDFPGLAFVRAAMVETTLPAFVIGGINPRNIHAAVEAGTRRVAVSAAIAQAEDPRSATVALLAALPAG